MGITIAIDDFGTGYSSLSHLKRFPIDTLKIDQTFVADLLIDPDDRAIVSAVIALAHALDINVVAEGVETVEQREMLKRMGCNMYQGYLFAKPCSAAQFSALLNVNKGRFQHTCTSDKYRHSREGGNPS
jgi:EAL domain-containing protein (putative c-di-GMP-specific phosphodiesterase class I)